MEKSTNGGYLGEFEADESYFGASRVRGKRAEKGSMIYRDSWKAYDGLMLDGYKHQRIKHGENEFDKRQNHINGIESFWSYAKRRLSKFNGISKHKFEIHLKECEFDSITQKKFVYVIIKNT